jgi:hypothetical protein
MALGRCDVCGLTVARSGELHMLVRLKKALVESYVGAIALGWIFAQSIFRLINVVTKPLSEWEAQRVLSELRMSNASQSGFSLRSSIPELVAALALALVGLLLLRWLYYAPVEAQTLLAGSSIDQ